MDQQNGTSQTRFNLKLQESEAKYQQLFTTMVQGVVYQNANGEIESANPAAQQILGMTVDQMRGLTSMDPRWKAIYEDGTDFPGHLHPIPVALKTGKEVRDMVHGVFNPVKEKTIWIRVNAIPLFKPGETIPYQAYATIEDITELKVAEEEIKNDQISLRKAQEIGKLGYCRIDTKRPFIWASEEAMCIYGFPPKAGELHRDIIGACIPEIDIVRHASVDLVENGKKYDIEFTINPADGSPQKIIAALAELERDKNGAPLYIHGVFQDITERVKTEQALQKAQKLESLGVLAGGIAHDFNNLLGGIFGYIDLAKEICKDSTIARYLSKSMNTIDRARGLTQQLLTFAKGGAPVKTIESISPLVKETTKFTLSGSNVSCTFELPADLWICNIDKNQIEQVIDNLVINAQQAMPSGGVIEISAVNLHLGESEHLILKTGSYVKISIKDYGVGIPQEHLSRIFDPFFTTKAKRHGLGLATCYSIVNRHGGHIDIESELGRGSTFHLYLSATENSVIPKVDKTLINHEKNRTFMVMDDEVVLQEVIGDILTSIGFNVVIKENGQDVINYFLQEKNANQTIAGVILDLTIPGGMGGMETIKELRLLDEHVPIFVASGYASDPVMANPTMYGFTGSICKPFRKVELIKALETYYSDLS